MKTIGEKKVGIFMFGSYQLSSRFLLAGILREACVRSLGGSLENIHTGTRSVSVAHTQRQIFDLHTFTSLPIVSSSIFGTDTNDLCGNISKFSCHQLFQPFLGRNGNTGVRSE